MRTWMIGPRLLMVLLIVLLPGLLVGCTGTPAPASSTVATPSSLGGRMGTRAVPPTEPMNVVEETIAGRLSTDLREQELGLDYLDCPQVTRRMPQSVTCAAYVDGVTADVLVRLTGSTDEGIEFDARLGGGIVATSMLVRRLAAEGYRRIDCGERSAYPAVVGSRIVCAVTRADSPRYVVATVTTESGEVEISDY